MLETSLKAKLSRLVKQTILRKPLEEDRRREVIEARQTDYGRWTTPDSYRDAWLARTELALKYRGSATWICDLGCGPWQMRRLLPANVVYLPMDLKKWTEDTITCDINKKRLPAEYLDLSDQCYVMGVLEYIYDAPWFMKALHSHLEELLISYNVREDFHGDRTANGWVNEFSTEEFKSLLTEAGFEITDSVVFAGCQLILRASNRSFTDSKREERRQRREDFLSRRQG